MVDFKTLIKKIGFNEILKWISKKFIELYNQKGYCYCLLLSSFKKLTDDKFSQQSKCDQRRRVIK